MAIIDPTLSNGLTPETLGRDYGKDAIQVKDAFQGVWGSPIPLSQGSRAIVGVPIWFGPLVTTTSTYTTGTATSGTNLGPNGGAATETRYSRDFAVAFGHNLGVDGEHADPQIKRIWVNGVLAYDATGGLPAPVDPVFATNAQRLQMAYSKALTALTFTLYPGTQTQKPDPLILADKGDLCSPYHGLIYIVFHDMTMGQNIATHVADGADFASLSGGLELWTTSNQAWNAGVGEAHLFGTDGQGGAFPFVQVEFIDGALVQAVATTVSNSGIGSGLSMNNWASRIAKVFTDPNTTQRLHTIDLNAQVELPTVNASGLVDGAAIGTFSMSGPVTGPCVWEQTGNYIYTIVGSSNSAPIIAINADTGVVSSQVSKSGNDLTPADATHGSCYTLHTDCTYFPLPRHACVCYALDGSATPTPVICIGLYDVAAIPVVTAGALPATLPYGSFFNPGAFAAGLPVSGMCPIPLGQIASARGLNTMYQDIAFFYMYGSKFEVEFFSVHAGKAQYLQSSVALDVGTGRVAMAVLLDPLDDSAIFFHTGPLGADWQITKLPLKFGSVTVPGFRGLCPSFGVASYSNVSIPSVSADLDDTINNSDVSQGTFGYTNGGNAIVIDLASGNTTSTAASVAFGAPSSVWDSKTNTIFGINANFYKQLPVSTSLSGSNSLPLSTYLRWLALQAGYTNAQISVDPALTDPIDGAMILQPTDVAVMFSELGRLYDFTVFESEGKIKFVPASHNPLKATGTLLISTLPSENDQVRLGSVTYRFTANPSVINDVRIASTAALSAQVLVAAINASGVSGTDYFPGTKQNPDAEASIVAGNLLATARSGGTIGNLIPTTVPVGTMSWAHTTLTGGDVPPVPSINLTPANMAPLSENTVASDNEVLVTTLNQPNTVPAALSINYWDESMFYQRSTQTFQPDASVAAGAATDITALNSIFVMTSAEAFRRVSKLSIRATQAAVTQEFRLPWKYLFLEPSDVVGITLAPFAYVVRLDECTINGDFSVSCAGFNYAFRDDIPVPDQTTLGLIADPVPDDGSGLPVVLDIPLFEAAKGTTPGNIQVEVGVKAAQSIVPFGTSATSFGPASAGSMVTLSQFDTDLKFGTALTALPDTTIPFQTDNVNTLTLVGKTAVASLFKAGTQLDALAGKNCIILGAPGRWEIIYFRDVTFVNERVVTIGGLMRGRRGTEINTGTHVAGETFYLLSSLSPLFAVAVIEQILDKTTIGVNYIYNAVGVPNNRAYRTQVTFTGLSLYPFAPCRLKAVLNQPTNNDLNLSWLRRDRAGTHWVTLPTEMSETVENYDLDIYNGAAVVRTLTNLTTPAYTYSVADQTTDGFVAPLTTIKFAVAQKGELGRGFQRLETVNVG